MKIIQIISYESEESLGVLGLGDDSGVYLWSWEKGNWNMLQKGEFVVFDPINNLVTKTRKEKN